MHKIENDSRKKRYSSPAPVWTDCFSDLQALLSLFKYFQFFKNKFVPVYDGNIVMQPPSALPGPQNVSRDAWIVLNKALQASKLFPDTEDHHNVLNGQGFLRATFRGFWHSSRNFAGATGRHISLCD